MRYVLLTYLLCMRSISNSFGQWTTNFKKPLGKRLRVSLSEPREIKRKVNSCLQYGFLLFYSGDVSRAAIEQSNNSFSSPMHRHTETNLWLGDCALKSPSHTWINTLLFAPWWSTDTEKLLMLMTLKRLRPLLDDLRLVKGSDLRHDQ